MNEAPSTYASDFASEETTIDLDQDGDGPHEVELTRRSSLRVTLELADAAESATPRAWVKVIPATDATGKSLNRLLASARKMSAGADGTFEQAGLEAGSYVVAASRLGDEAEVTETITIGEGLTEHRIVLGELDNSSYLVARCIGPDGEPIPRIQFRGAIDNGAFPRPSYVKAVDRGADGYWLPIESISGDEPWSESSKVTLTATARNLGELTVPLVLGQRNVEFTFQPTCSIDVRVEGSELAGLAVNATTVDDDGGDQPLRRILRLGGRPTALDATGHALIEGLQPGRFRVSLVRGGTAGRLSPPLATADVTLTSGTHKIVLSAPVLYEVAVHAANIDVGTRLYLVKADRAETAAGMLDGLSTAVDDEHRSLFADVPPGDYVLSALAAGRAQMRVTVPCGEVEFVADVIDAFGVSDVKPGKLGARAGLRAGDLVVALDGEAVNGNNFHQKLAVAIESAAVELTVERGGSSVTISLGPIEAGSAAWEQIGVRWSPRTR